MAFPSFPESKKCVTRWYCSIKISCSLHFLPIFEEIVEKEKYTVQVESLSETEKPVLITQSEFMRRMKEQQAAGGGGMNMMGVMPEMYNLVVNTNHPLISKVITSKGKNQKVLAKQALDLALLSHGMLKGKDLSDFVERSFELI